LGPWTFADLLLQAIYIASNSFCIRFRCSDIAEAGVRAGNLSLINMIPLFLGPHLGFLADILGISLSTFRLMHRSAGMMSCSLVLFHVLAMLVSHTAFPLRGTANLSAVVVSTLVTIILSPPTDILQSGASLGSIIVLSSSWSPLRRWFYEIFLRSHQLLAAIVATSTLLHIPSALFPRLYFYISLGIFIATSAYEGVLLLHRNGVVVRAKGRELPRVGEVFKYPGEDDNSPVQLTIIPPKPLEIKAGQYVNLYIPSLGTRSSIFMQSHPFVVASWTGKRQTKLELVIEPRRGWTKILQSRAITVSGQSGGLGRVLFTGPHGAIIPVGNYEYIFMVASGYGIVAHLPLLERLVQGTLAREVRARRICLVWEFEDIGEYALSFNVACLH
jgi:predicted ferric reductase